MLIDTHAHLDQEEFDADRAEVIARAVAAGVEKIVAIGVTADSSAAAVRLAAEHPAIYAAVGIQPNYCGQAQARRLGASCRSWPIRPKSWPSAKPGWIATGITRRLTCSRIISIGICGWPRSANLPFVVHTRESDADVLAMLREARQRGPLQRRHALVHRHGRHRRRVRGIGAVHQLCRHGHVQKIGRFAGRGRHGAGRSHSDRNRQPVSFARSVAGQAERAGQSGSYRPGAGRSAQNRASKISPGRRPRMLRHFFGFA